MVRIVGGLAILNLLVFAAGLFTGVSITFPELVKLQNAKAAEVQLAVKTSPAEPVPVAPAPPETAAQIAEEDMPAIEAPEVNEAAAADFSKPVEPAPVEHVAEVRPPAPVLPEKAVLDPSRYALQVGAFLSPDNADVLLQQLKIKGYTPYILTAPDSSGRSWHLVRIGKFVNRLTASSAASSFRSKENMTALVRPSNSM
jgi:DedD protein